MSDPSQSLSLYAPPATPVRPVTPVAAFFKILSAFCITPISYISSSFLVGSASLNKLDFFEFVALSVVE